MNPKFQKYFQSVGLFLTEKINKNEKESQQRRLVKLILH